MDATNCSYCEAVKPAPEVCGHPERESDPRDNATGWERGAAALCDCGRAVVVRGQCAYCLHGVKVTTLCYRCNGSGCRDCGVFQ